MFTDLTAPIGFVSDRSLLGFDGLQSDTNLATFYAYRGDVYRKFLDQYTLLTPDDVAAELDHLRGCRETYMNLVREGRGSVHGRELWILRIGELTATIRNLEKYAPATCPDAGAEVAAT